jgi:hypothetical protein
MEPALSCVFGLPPNLIMPPSVQFGFSLRMRLCEGRCGVLQGVVFMQDFFFEFQSYSRHRNHFDIGLKQTHFEEIQVIPMDKFS